MQKELIELLLENKIEEFGKRFQSFLNQIPKPTGGSSATGREGGFFNGYFLGMFANLKNTEVYERLNINEIHFKFDSANNLHVIVDYRDQPRQQIFIFQSERPLSDYQKKYKGDVLLLSVNKKKYTGIDGKEKTGLELKTEGSSLNNNYRIESDFNVIPEIKKNKKGTPYKNLEQYINAMSDTTDSRRFNPALEALLNFNTDLYHKINLLYKTGEGPLFNIEAFQHGFLTGGMMNFRYRDNLKAYVEIMLGSGYADMLLLVRGKERSQSAIPIIIELKKSSKDLNTDKKALKEAVLYAKGLNLNKIPIITNSEKIVCIGIDLKSRKFSSSIQKIKSSKEPFLQSLLDAVANIDTDKAENLLSNIHYSFPPTESNYDYLNNFLVGQSLIIDEVKDKGKISNKRLYKHKNNPYLTSFTFQIGDKLLILNINNRQRNKPEAKVALPIGKEIKTVIEVDIVDYNKRIQSSPGQHFHTDGIVDIKSFTSQSYIKRKSADVDYYPIISDSQSLKEKFNNAIEYQHNKLKDLIGDKMVGTNMVAMNEYKQLFQSISDHISKNNGYFEKISSLKEHMFKAFLDGILTGLSDIHSDNLRVLVPIEFQAGKGRRVDIAIQTIGKDGKHGTPILIELKLDNRNFEEATNQLLEYLNSANTKSITDGTEVAGFVAVLDLKAANPIKISDKLTVASVLHSSLCSSSSRKKRQLGMPCIDSRNEKDVIRDKNIIKQLLDIETIEKINLKRLENEVIVRYEDIVDTNLYTTSKQDILVTAYRSFVLNRVLAQNKYVSEEVKTKSYHNALFDVGALLHDLQDHVQDNDRIKNNELLKQANNFYNSKETLPPTESLKVIFNNENIKGLEKEFEIYNKEVITISPEQILTEGSNVYVELKNGGKRIFIGEVENLINPESYTLDDETFKIKITKDGKEIPLITETNSDGKIEYGINLDDGGYKIKLKDLINNKFGNVQDIYNKLDKFEALKEKQQAEKLIDMLNDGFDSNDEASILKEIKQGLLKKGIGEEYIDKLINSVSESSEKAYKEYFNSLKEKLNKHGIEFEFDTIKENSHLRGKYFSLMAIYDLIDSINDVSTLGRHNNSPLKTIFGVNGVFDAINDVRESLKFSSNSAIGKIINKIPVSTRQALISIINNPIVEGITFATIAYQFGYSINEIAQGNHHPLNYYWTGSSGIKLASMSIGPITAGVSSIIGGLSATTMSVIASVSSFLATASIVTAVADILIAIGVNLYQAVEYAKEIGRHIPTSLDEDILIVIDQSFIGWIIPGDKGKELEVVIKAKEYLNYIKETGSKLLCDSPLIAVVRYVPNTKEISSSVVHNKFISCGGGVPVGVVPPCNDICETMKGDSNTVFNISNTKGDLSLLNISNFLSLTPEILNNTKVYLDRDGRHIPHITESEYIEGLRIVDAPKTFEHHEKACKSNQECKIGEIKETCEESFSFLGSPFILANTTRKEGKILYSSVPSEFKSSENYPAIINVPIGQVSQEGPKNYETTFIVSNDSSGELKGGEKKQNTIIINTDYKNETIVDLNHKSLRFGSNEIEIENTYNLVANTTGNIHAFTDCKTRYISINSTADSYISPCNTDNCFSQDYEIREVNRNNNHIRGLKKIIFTVNEQSDGAKIYNGENIRSKKNVDIISITSNNVKIKVSKKIDQFYTLSLLNINEKIVANIRVEDFEKLLIEKDGKRYAFNSDIQELEQVFMTLKNNIEHPISNFKRYTPSEQGLQIYRNGESNIGLIDLRNKHSSDFTMKIINDTMIVSYKGTPYIRHEEWNTGESTRRVIYLFQDKQLLDSNCIVYNICNTNETIHLLNKRESVYNRRLEFNHKCLLSEGQIRRKDLIKKISQYTNQLKDNYYSYESLLDLAYEVQYMVGDDANYSEIRHSLDAFKNHLPDSIRNIVFSYVCIKNTDHSEYLYAASDYSNDSAGERRSIFTWIPRNLKNSKFQFKIERVDYNRFTIQNVEYGEYMYSPEDVLSYDSDRKPVYSWIPKNVMNDKFKWYIEFEGNQILLKNVRFNQYIYAANNYLNYDDSRRRVFTWKPGEKVTQGYWTVENCDTLSKVEGGSRSSMGTYEGTFKVNYIPTEELQENFRNVKYSQVCIKNVKFQEHLYYDYDIREISSRVQKDDKSLWKLEYSRDFLFYIRHVKSNKYLCSGYGQYHQYGREITALDGAYKESKCEWGLDTQNRIVNFDSQEPLFAAPNYFNYEKGKRRILTLVHKNDIAEYNNSHTYEQSIQGSNNDYVCSIEPLVIDKSNVWMIENCNSKPKKINHHGEKLTNKNTPKRILRNEKRIKRTASNLDVSDNLIKSETSKYSWFSNLTIGIKNVVNRLNFSKTKESLSDYENSRNIIKKWNSENINNSHLHKGEGFDLNGNLMLAHIMINKFPLNKLFLRRKESVQRTPNLEDRKQNDKSMLQEQTIVDISRTQNRLIKPSTLIGNVTIDTAVDKRRVI